MVRPTGRMCPAVADLERHPEIKSPAPPAGLSIFSALKKTVIAAPVAASALGEFWEEDLSVGRTRPAMTG